MAILISESLSELATFAIHQAPVRGDLPVGKGANLSPFYHRDETLTLESCSLCTSSDLTSSNVLDISAKAYNKLSKFWRKRSRDPAFSRRGMKLL